MTFIVLNFECIRILTLSNASSLHAFWDTLNCDIKYSKRVSMYRLLESGLRSQLETEDLVVHGGQQVLVSSRETLERIQLRFDASRRSAV